MSRRLQVLLSKEEMDDIRRLAELEHIPVGEWVRRVPREARAARSKVDPREKLAAVREAVAYSFPTGDITQINADIEKGYTD